MAYMMSSLSLVRRRQRRGMQRKQPIEDVDSEKHPIALINHSNEIIKHVH